MKLHHKEAQFVCLNTHKHKRLRSRPLALQQSRASCQKWNDLGVAYLNWSVMRRGLREAVKTKRQSFSIRSRSSVSRFERNSTTDARRVSNTTVQTRGAMGYNGFRNLMRRLDQEQMELFWWPTSIEDVYFNAHWKWTKAFQQNLCLWSPTEFSSLLTRLLKHPKKMDEIQLFYHWVSRFKNLRTRMWPPGRGLITPGLGWAVAGSSQGPVDLRPLSCSSDSPWLQSASICDMQHTWAQPNLCRWHDASSASPTHRNIDIDIDVCIQSPLKDIERPSLCTLSLRSPK